MLPDTGAVIVIKAVLLTLPDVAVTVTLPGMFEDVKVAVAMPLEVVAWALIVPIAGTLNAKVTIVPSGIFAPSESSTVADILDVANTLSEVGVAVSVNVAA
jgi:hypothetical protein